MSASTIKKLTKPPVDPHWAIPCEMEDGTLRQIYVKKGANPPEIEKRLARLHRQAAKITAERAKLDGRLAKISKTVFDA